MQKLRYAGVLALAAFACLAWAGPAAAEDFPKGTFTLKGPDNAAWAVKLDGKGTFSVTRDGAEGVEGTYKVTNDQIEFTDVKGPFAEKGANKTGTYKWKFADKKLTFIKVKDDAEGRSMIVTSGSWVLKE